MDPLYDTSKPTYLHWNGYFAGDPIATIYGANVYHGLLLCIAV